MKNDFLTIPNAPDYEINSKLVCRNKITDKFLKPDIRHGKRGDYIYYRLIVDKKIIRLSAKTLRNKAWAPFDKRIFYLVPSLDGKYEVTRTGVLRNVKSKRILKPKKIGIYQIQKPNGKIISISLVKIFWEVFGVLPPKSSNTTKPVIVSQGNRCYYFDKKSAAAKFLAPIVFLSKSTIQACLSQRRKEIFGWEINYLEDELPTVGPYIKGASSCPKEGKFL